MNAELTGGISFEKASKNINKLPPFTPEIFGYGDPKAKEKKV